jgi:amino acid adenylation domain-containing protein
MHERLLHHFLEDSAARHSDRIAVVEPGHAGIRYTELNRLANSISDTLSKSGVGPGDRIGVHLSKSVASLASVFGILKTGAAYVPVDSTAPAARNAYIFSDCGVRFVITRDPDGTGLDTSQSIRQPFGTSDDELGDLVLVRGANDDQADAVVAPRNLAYILYTSGSTGKPKGVMLTHANALAFVDWCSETFAPTETDRFSSHAPFHFDLSILDIFLSIKHGARLVLIDEGAGRQPKRLASIIADEGITIWYSTPSILRLLLDVKDIDNYNQSTLRIVFYAGEVFPIKHLRALVDLWPAPRYFNLYGPTETNVCTYFEVPTPLPAHRTEPIPIGQVCCGDTAKVMDEHNHEVSPPAEGELYVTGPSVTTGYWNLPERNAIAFYTDSAGTRWYKTGDIVRQDSLGNYIYVGRRDRMIKRRGYRVELGEIEAALYRHACITESAVIACEGQDDSVSVVAFIAWNGDTRPSTIALKRFCIENLPAYMIPDRFSVQTALPKTSTDKIDYQRLKEMA